MLCAGGGSGSSGNDRVAMPNEWSNDELSSEGDRDVAAELRELKPAKQTVRDVRAVAQTVFGIELDHRIVSVAQLNTNDQNTPVGIELPRSETRARVGAINIEAVGLRSQVRVVLVDNDRELAERGATAAGRGGRARRAPPG